MLDTWMHCNNFNLIAEQNINGSNNGQEPELQPGRSNKLGPCMLSVIKLPKGQHGPGSRVNKLQT